MAVKSVIDVEIDREGAFARFSALYSKYQAQLKASPAEWAKMTAGIGKTRKEFDELVKRQMAMQGRQKLIAQASADAERLTRTSAEKWRDIASSTGRVFSNVAGITRNLLRWSALGTLGAGLLGGGSLWGINSLASMVAANRRSSLGLGVSYGAQQSFGANFNRLVPDPEGFLAAVAEAKSDVTKRVGLHAAGLSQSEVNQDTESVSLNLLRRLKHIADTTDPKFDAQTIASRQLGNFTNTQMLSVLRGTSREEFESLFSGHAQGRNRFDVGAGTQRAWQELETQLTRAAVGIKSTLVDTLGPLAPKITKLSSSFEEAVRSIAQSELFKDGIDSLGRSVRRLGEYIGSEEFLRDLKSFTEGVGKLARAISWLVGKLPNFEKAPKTNGRKPWLDLGPLGTVDPHLIPGGFLDRTLKHYRSPAGQSDSKKRTSGAVQGGMVSNASASSSDTSFSSRFGAAIDAVNSGVFDPQGMNFGTGVEFAKHTGLKSGDPQVQNQQTNAMQGGGWKAYPMPAGFGVGTGTKVVIENNTGGNVSVTTSQMVAQ